MYINGVLNGICGLILFCLALFFTSTKFSGFLHVNTKNYFNFIISGLFGGFIFQILVGLPGLISGSQNIIVDSKGIKSSLMFMLAYGFCFFTMATFEEFLFRDYILKRFMSKFSPYISIIFESLIFSLLHFFTYLNTNDLYMNLINAFMFGIFLSILAIKDGSLIRCIGFHLSSNLFELLLYTENNYKFNRFIYFSSNDKNIIFIKNHYVMFILLIIAIITTTYSTKFINKFKNYKILNK